MGTTTPTLAELSNAIRFLAADAIEKAKSGHPGMPLGMADVATVLFSNFMKFEAKNPAWPDRDRFILSAGHGSMLIYSLLYLNGYPGMDIEQIRNFRQMGSITAGHPEYGHTPGVEMTTGPLGQGIATAVGFALAERMQNARFGDDLVDHYTYVIAGDGCLMEGISQEAISLAGHWKLHKLIVLWDDNHICIDGDTALSTSEDQLARFAAAGWATSRVDGHDHKAIERAIAAAKSNDRPTLIACKTTIGFGAPTKAGSEKTHGAPLGAEELAGMRKLLNWPYEAFDIPSEILAAWREIGTKGSKDREAWEARFKKAPEAQQDEFVRLEEGRPPQGWMEALNNYKAKMGADKPKVATRKASQDVLEVLTTAIPEMIGGSADLTHSNLTITKAANKAIKAGDFSGRYIHYGVREHGMAAIMNGLSLHGGFIPYGGTFLVFSDYLRPSLRLAALMGVRAIHVLTHDSIGLGEDGPTHQPVEHVASLRAMPNLLVFRPADIIETIECWALAVTNKKGPAVLALSRQNLPTLRDGSAENLSAKGAYVLKEAAGPRKVTLLATGSEVEIALKAQADLAKEGINAAVVSMPSWELFERQPESYKAGVLGPNTVRVAVEALSCMGWDKYVGEKGAIVAMKSFGASAPADKLYAHFGITSEKVVEQVKSKL